MMDIQNLASQVKRNCNVSDARYWGYYSLCGLLLRLRELYRIEKGIRLWEKIPQNDVGEWITARERLWAELEDKDYEKISVNGTLFDPFEVVGINALLDNEGLTYGAGYGLHMKPCFFIADIISKEKIDEFTVYITGKEYARDISDYPAMLQDHTIIVRADTLKHLFWQRFEELRCKSKESLVFAFSRYGITPEETPSEDIDRRMHQVARSEAETYVWHELGEAFEGEKIGDVWKILIRSLYDGRAGIFARSVKDILSDTSERGMLKHIIDHEKDGSLGFYMVFMGGMRKVLFPEILDAFQVYVKTGDWTPVDNARRTGYRRAGEYAERLLALYSSKKNDAALKESIEQEILSGLL